MVNIYQFLADITTSGLKKQTSTNLEFYFWFRFRPFSRNLHFILHQPVEFRPNRSSHCRNITSYCFINMAASDGEYSYYRFRICCYHCLQKVKVCANQVSSTYLDCWLRFNYFRLLKTNVRHIRILLPILIAITSLNLHVILHHATEFRPNRSTHCRNMTSFPFFEMAAATAKYQFRFRIDASTFRWSKSISKPNFADISQLTAEI